MIKELKKETKNFKINSKVKLFFKESWIYFAIATVLLLGGMAIIGVLFPRQVQPLNITWNGVLMFMGICAGVGWVVHGTGFLLVRVSR